MTISKSAHNQKEISHHSSSKLFGKNRYSILGLVAQSSFLLLKSLTNIHGSIFPQAKIDHDSNENKNQSSVDANAASQSSTLGPLELRGKELINKFKHIAQLTDFSNRSSIPTSAPAAPSVETSAVVSRSGPRNIPEKLIGRSFTASDILRATKLRSMRSAKVIDELAVNELMKASVTQLTTLSRTSVGSRKVSRTETFTRPAMFTSFDLKSVKLKKNGADVKASTSSSSAPVSIKVESKPSNENDKKRSFNIADVLNVKLRPVIVRENSKRQRTSHSGGTRDSSDLTSKADEKRKSPHTAKIQSPPKSMHSALKAALAKKFNKAVVESAARAEAEKEAESPMSTAW